LSWRWVFYVNVPVGVAALFVTSSVLRLPFTRREHRIDFVGAALLIAGVSVLLLALVWGGKEHPWTSSTILGLAASSTALLAGFVTWEQRASEPILPMRLFRGPVFSVGIALSFILGCAMFGAIVFLPLFLQAVTGASATNSGLLLLPLMAGLMLTSVGSGRLIARTGRYHRWPIAGMLVSAGGMALLATMDDSTSRFTSSAYMVVLGLGMGMVMQVLVLAVQNAAEPPDMGVVTSAVNFFRSLGGSFGVAVFGAIFASLLSERLGTFLPAGALSSVGLDPESLSASPEQLRALPPDLLAPTVRALSESTTSVFLYAVPVLLVGFVLSFRLPGLPLRETVNLEAAVEGAELADEDASAEAAAHHTDATPARFEGRAQAGAEPPRPRMVNHAPTVPWPRGPDRSLIARCTCGWQSKPCANGEFANQAWERHAAATTEAGEPDDDH